MNDIMDAQWKLVPELKEMMELRYQVLKLVKIAGPIGRRPLGMKAGLSEREARTVIDLLRAQNLIDIAKEGATITAEGHRVLLALESTMEDWSGRIVLGKRLKEAFNIQSVQIVPGNCDTDTATKDLLGMEGAKQFTAHIGDGKIVAVTGGSTIAAIPQHLEKQAGLNDILFIAARGGVGNVIGLQANVIAASFAEVLNGSYSTFYYPEALSEYAHEAFKKEPSVKQMLKQYEATDCVIHGIGNAETMAALRSSPHEEQEMLKSLDAKGEAFGYYFDENGKVVHQLRTVGIRKEHVQNAPLVMAVAGGSSKAEAILAYMATAPKQTILITDEGAANEMIKILQQRD